MPRLMPLVLGVVAILAGCATAAIDQPTAPASVSATSSPSPEPGIPSPSPSQAPTDHSAPAPTLPAGTAAPRAPTGLSATSQAVPCPGASGHGAIVLAHAVAAIPECLLIDLGWVPVTGTAVYRIYEAWSGEGAGAACDRASATLIATSAPHAATMTLDPLPLSVGGGELCLYVAAANSAGESSRVQFTWVSP